MWKTPIFDRTSEDVTYINTLHQQILSDGFNSLTDAEKLDWLYGGSDELFATDGQLLTSDSEIIVVGGSTGTTRGAINAMDLNRIERNCEYLQDQLLLNGYSTIIERKVDDWTVFDFLYADDILRIRDNIRAILFGFSTLGGSPTITDNYDLDVTDINELEENLHNLNYLLELMIDAFRVCGTFYSGQDYAF